VSEPRDHADNRNWLETVLKKIPGFKGYLEKENRRESDALQREWLADRLQRSKKGIDTVTRTLVDAGQIDVLPQFDRLRAQSDKLIGRIRGAMQGYSGIFDLVRVDEAVLDKVYEHDVMMMDRIEALARGIESLPASVADKPAEAVNSLLQQLDEAEQIWNKRENILKGLE